MAFDINLYRAAKAARIAAGLPAPEGEGDAAYYNMGETAPAEPAPEPALEPVAVEVTPGEVVAEQLAAEPAAEAAAETAAPAEPSPEA